MEAAKRKENSKKIVSTRKLNSFCCDLWENWIFPSCILFFWVWKVFNALQNMLSMPSALYFSVIERSLLLTSKYRQLWNGLGMMMDERGLSMRWWIQRWKENKIREIEKNSEFITHNHERKNFTMRKILCGTSNFFLFHFSLHQRAHELTAMFSHPNATPKRNFYWLFSFFDLSSRFKSLITWASLRKTREGLRNFVGIPFPVMIIVLIKDNPWRRHWL